MEITNISVRWRRRWSRDRLSCQTSVKISFSIIYIFKISTIYWKYWHILKRLKKEGFIFSSVLWMKNPNRCCVFLDLADSIFVLGHFLDFIWCALWMFVEFQSLLQDWNQSDIWHTILQSLRSVSSTGVSVQAVWIQCFFNTPARSDYWKCTVGVTLQTVDISLQKKFVWSLHVFLYFVIFGDFSLSTFHIFRVVTSLCTMPNKSFLQARCEEPLMTSDWGIPLVLALLLLALLYAFLYLPATAQRALLEQALSSNNTTTAVTTDDWITDE